MDRLTIDAHGDLVFAACAALAARTFRCSATRDDDAMLLDMLRQGLDAWRPKSSAQQALAKAAAMVLDGADPTFQRLRPAVTDFARWRVGQTWDRITEGKA
jgi:hypothetical protein